MSPASSAARTGAPLEGTAPGPGAAAGTHPRIPALSGPTATLAEARQPCSTAGGGGARRRVRVRGRVAELRIPAVSQTPSCEALLLVRDPEHPEALPAPLRLVWQGQRTVPGVGAGTELSCSGLLCAARDEPTIYNPHFEIVSRRGLQ